MSMTKTLVSIDRHKAEVAGRILQTSTLTATIDAALDEEICSDRRSRLIERVR